MKPPNILILLVLLKSASSFSPTAVPRRSIISISTSTTSSHSTNLIEHTWKWRGHDIFTVSKTPPQPNHAKPTILLLHGFGASTTYWRQTLLTLSNEGYPVHALDLLGQGRSSKPTDGSVTYSIHLWAHLADDYARHHGMDGVVLAGNSLGSLVALAAATGDFETDGDTHLAGRVRGVCLFNCAVGLNSRNVLKNPNLSPVMRWVGTHVFDLWNGWIFDNTNLLRFVLENVVSKGLLRDVLKGLYVHSPDRVDEELVDSFYYPAKDGGEGAVEAIRQIYTNDAGLTPMELHERYPHILDAMPLHLIWGDEDAVTPITGDVGVFYCDWVANNRGGRGRTSLDVVKGGHVPFDDNPVDTHESMLRWLETKVLK